ncbi:MAG: hypothetical protein QOE63_1027 [Acidimicrobiaceae bacterium]
MTPFPAVLLSLRIGWLVLGIVGALGLSGALDERSTPVIVVAVLLAALAWGAGVVALLLPRSASLTTLRLLGVGFLLPAPLVDVFVDGSSYGPERRFALRTPMALVLGPIELAWLAVAGPAVAGPLLLAARQWVAGALVVLAGAVAARWAVRSLHLLARRWIVFVPAGLVVHDPMVLTDAVLFPKAQVASIGPALADETDGALDVTGGAPGLVLELRLREPAPIGVIEHRHEGATFEAHRLLVTPNRPGAVLAEAAARSFSTQ